MNMKDSDLAAVIGLNKRRITIYRTHCGLKKGDDWNEVALGKLAGFLKLGAGSLTKTVIKPQDEQELVICKIYQRPSGSTWVINKTIYGCRFPGKPDTRPDDFEKLKGMKIHAKIGMRVRAIKDAVYPKVWKYAGMVRGQ